MHNGIFDVPEPWNEPVKDYAPGSPERAELKERLSDWMSAPREIPCVIGGRRVRTGRLAEQRMPHRHRQAVAHVHQAGPRQVRAAVRAAREAWEEWSRTPWETRVAIFLKAADLLSGPYRAEVNAATMLGQSKTVHQAEIDAACELADFWRFNCAYLQQIYEDQPFSPPGQWNTVEYRPLEGFVLAITPFNFTSIGGNLPTAPALMGNTVLWKPASTAVASNYVVLQVLEEAGLPPGVINFLPGPGREIGPEALGRPELAGVHFTGSTETFLSIWETVGRNIRRYAGYPRLVGETGGKDFVFVHASADVDETATALVRGAFEYQGQKCSAASRAYVPRSLWPKLRRALGDQLSEVKVGDPTDFTNFMAAVIDRPSFDKITGYIRLASRSARLKILHGGGADRRRGYFIEPTVVLTEDPKHRLMREEIFGPVLTIFVYPDARLDEAIELCDSTSPYALTGAVFARDRRAIQAISQALRHAAGNFYINDKPTGAVVGQQPFGGGRASGTNDKAGSPLNLLRWASPRAVKETFAPPRHFAYPFMAPEEE
ncbi:MAG: L-glutamate gamma-semialdehyde dehydrogenase [Acidobacteria bacterium]|nr:MAG: L-glutamate gamma-semialdehyde dehydrogenase [Acidobacteriota bacterium]